MTILRMVETERSEIDHFKNSVIMNIIRRHFPIWRIFVNIVINSIQNKLTFTNCIVPFSLLCCTTLPLRYSSSTAPLHCLFRCTKFKFSLDYHSSRAPDYMMTYISEIYIRLYDDLIFLGFSQQQCTRLYDDLILLGLSQE